MTSQESSSQRQAPRPALLGRWAIVAWFCVLFGLPLVLFMAGVRPPQIEKRRPAEAPGAFFASSLLDTDWWAQIADWYTDRLPGRDLGVEADAWVDLHLLGDSPDPRVILGTEDWLYLREAVSVACVDEGGIRRAVDQVALVVRVLAAAGKRLVLVVAPNKAAIYPEHLGDATDDTGCADANRAAFRGMIGAGEVVGFVDAWAVLGQARDTLPGLLYHRLDTHWTTLGAAQVGEAVVESLAPGLWDPAALTFVRSSERRGDLTVLIGLPLTEMAEYWQVERAVRPRVTSQPLGAGATAVTSRLQGVSTTGATGLMLHDSTGFALARVLRPYFGTLTTVRFRENVSSFGAGAPWFAEQLRAADLLILVSVEREVLDRLHGGLAAELVGALADALPSREIRLAPDMAGAGSGVRWVPATEELVTTGDPPPALALPDLGAAAGGDRYLVVEMAPHHRTEVRLTWQAPGGRPGELVRTVSPSDTVLVMGLPAEEPLTKMVLQPGSGEGHRVLGISVVDIPTG